ncbi:uncharacterized protein LOC110418041 [Herrania umbratica]|uniref:Uncharacterized protein LOC110418041 n=1 Tax=Herrania umbratica TaxID=108875 RepID=A0A6J1AHP9_9ROSI|nr:uncharacterized protein LOC110418041 [Herrania umbratica]
MISKLLTNTDIEKSLLVPASSLSVLPFEEGHFFYINVIDKIGEGWSFPCFIQQSEGIESSVVSVGWLKFLCDRDVRVGDMVFLHQESMDDDSKGTGAQLKIEVKRKIRLLGEDIWAAVE